ncbi:MAG TPA: M48 family metallopeptidase [Bacteroidia bacterium]|nr:M48 family metallopeptidase [Bacteroidia bacterium]
MDSLVPAIYAKGNSAAAESVHLSFDESSDDLVIHFAQDTRVHWHIRNIQVCISGQLATASHPGIAGASVQFQQLEFARFLTTQQYRKGYSGLKSKVNSGGLFFFFLFFSGFIAIVFSCYFLLLPWIAERAVDLLPLSVDERIGKTIYENTVTGETTDTAQTRRMNAFASHFEFHSNQPLHFSVVRSKEMNAFALPDGNIVIYSGILPILKSENELAALLCHESAHVKKRHSMKLLAKNLAAYLLVSVIMSDVQGVMATLVENANTLGSLSFSRAYEEEADLEGLNILNANSVNAEGMTDLLNSLQAHDSLQIPDFLSTHPVTKNRILYVRNAIAEKAQRNPSRPELKTLFNEIKQNANGFPF